MANLIAAPGAIKDEDSLADDLGSILEPRTEIIVDVPTGRL